MNRSLYFDAVIRFHMREIKIIGDDKLADEHIVSRFKHVIPVVAQPLDFITDMLDGEIPSRPISPRRFRFTQRKYRISLSRKLSGLVQSLS